ncbi:hypothetical protein CsSME_00044506 [Camellia sinensis var. sinensis]
MSTKGRGRAGFNGAHMQSHEDSLLSVFVLFRLRTRVCSFTKKGNTSALGTQVHCEMICRDSVSWNSLIAGYFENGILRIGFFVRPF